MTGPGGAGHQDSTHKARATTLLVSDVLFLANLIRFLKNKKERKNLVFWPYFLKVKLTEVHRIGLLQLISSQGWLQLHTRGNGGQDPPKHKLTFLISPAGFNCLQSLDFAEVTIFGGKDFIFGSFGLMTPLPLVQWQLEGMGTSFTWVSGFWSSPG